jgi:hypothetical protein
VIPPLSETCIHNSTERASAKSAEVTISVYGPMAPFGPAGPIEMVHGWVMAVHPEPALNRCHPLVPEDAKRRPMSCAVRFRVYIRSSLR